MIIELNFRYVTLDFPEVSDYIRRYVHTHIQCCVYGYLIKKRIKFRLVRKIDSFLVGRDRSR